MKIIALIFILLNLPLANASQTQKLCQDLGGKMVNKLQCPQSKDNRPLVYFNGCTKSVGEYGSVFFKACLKHDFCYHHEPATNGYSKKHCDKQFYVDMLNTCVQEEDFSNVISCSAMALGFYQAVKFGGDNSWECSNSNFDYSAIDRLLDYVD